MKCKICESELETIDISKYSDIWKSVVRCPKCHIVYDLRD